MAKNQSLPDRLQEKDSRGEDNLTMYEYHVKPTVWWPRPSLSNPLFGDQGLTFQTHALQMILFGPFLRANPKLLRFVTNRVLTERFLPKKKKTIWKV